MICHHHRNHTGETGFYVKVPTAVLDLLERERELDVLARMVRAAGDGSYGVVRIEGEAGIGKTALLSAARDLATEAGMAVLSARAGELESEFAWGVVRQLFDATVARAPAADRARLLSGAAALARPALGIDAEENSVDASFATLHGLYWLTVNLAQRQPLMLAVDDAHWADSPSLRYVAHLLPRIAGLPIMLVLATRPPSAEARPDAELLARIAAEPTLTTLRPAALTSAASAALVRDQLAPDTRAEICHACHELSGGNPFLLRALLTELKDEEDDGAEVTVEHVRRLTPAAVSASVLLRLALLPPEALALARAVAILGASAPLHTAGLLAGLEVSDAAEHAAALIRAGILTEDDPLAFVHPLVRAAVYEDLAGPRRSVWHHRAARLLADGQAPAERVAVHLVQAAPGADRWTVDQLRRGAAAASARGAPDIAADYLRRGLAESVDADARGALLFELGEAELVHAPALAAPHLTEALRLVRDPREHAEVALTLGNALALLGRPADAIPVLGSGIAGLGANGPSELSDSLEAARLDAVRWEVSAQTERRELVDAIRKRAASGERLGPRLHAQLAVEAAADGINRAAAIEHARASLTTAEAPTGAATSALTEAMLVLVFADLAAEARDAIDAWQELARARAWPLAMVLGGTVSTLACLYRGAVSEAVVSARGAVAPGTDIRLAPITVGFLVEALAERGEIDAARSELAERGLDGDLPYAWPTTPLLLARGRLFAAAGDHAAATRDLTAAGERSETWGIHNPAMHPWRSSLAVSLARLGESKQAIALADTEIELARRWGAPRAIGVALRAAGIVHGGRYGLALLREAAAVLEPSTAPLEHARALVDLGSAVRRAGRRAEAREHLRRGLDVAHHLGAVAVAERARGELAIAGARPRRDALRGRDALTPSELRVSALAATGRTNREIAETLFVTSRTVEAHLTSSYGKLGIASRQQLASALAGSASADAVGSQ